MSHECDDTAMSRHLAQLAFVVCTAALGASASSTLGLTTDQLARGETVRLHWGGVAQSYYPLRLQARFFNQTSGGIFSIRTTIATGLSGTEFDWENVPAPLDFIPSARYELILVPQGVDEPRLGYEGLFRIAEPEDTGAGSDNDDGGGDNGSSIDDPLGSGTAGDEDDGDNKKLAVGTGVGLGLGLPVAIMTAWWFSRTTNKAKQRIPSEKRL